MSNLNEWDQAKEEASAGTISTQELDELAQKLQAAWAKHEVVNKEAGVLYREAEDVEAKFILALEQAGKTKYFVEGIGTYSFTNRMSYQTPKTLAEKQALARWVEETMGKAEFWTLFGVNSASLQKFCKDALAEHEKKCEESGNPEPFHIPGLQAPTAMKSLRLTKEK